MARITVLGGTGYTGSAIVQEARARGHEVTSLSRSAPAEPLDGVTYLTGSVLDEAVLAEAVAGAEVIIEALAPRGELAGRLLGVDTQLAGLAAASGARLGVIGGFSTLRPEPGAPRFAEGELDPAFADEAREMAAVLARLHDSAESLDWFYVSPAAGYGSYAPGPRRGSYRIGGDVAQFDAAGRSELSAPDLAAAVLDEIETPRHHRAQFSVAY